MTTAEIARRIEEVLLNGTWICNTNFQAQIEAVSFQQATIKMHHLNSIALLTFHIDYYINGVCEVLEGGPLTIRDKFSFDMEDVNDENSWELLVKRFVNNSMRLVALVKDMDPDQLAEDFSDPKYGDNLRNLEGVIEHAYYHLGQVVIIAKMVGGAS